MHGSSTWLPETSHRLESGREKKHESDLSLDYIRQFDNEDDGTLAHDDRTELRTQRKIER